MMRTQGRNDIANGEARRRRVGEHAGHERAQPTVAFARRMGLRGCGADERPDAAPGLEDAGTLELRVHPCNRIGVDAEIYRELADSRQLIAGTQAARSDCRPQPALELGVDRRGITAVDGDDAHLPYYTSSLVQSVKERERWRSVTQVIGHRQY